MKAFKLGVSVLFIIFMVACNTDNELKNSENQNLYTFDRTKISLNGNNSIFVTTDNTYADFKHNKVYVGNNVTIENNIVTSTNKTNLWFVPFDKNDEPIILSRGDDSENGNNSGFDPGDITISCDCSSGSVGSCTVEETNNGGSVTFTCSDACTNGCNMSVEVEKSAFTFDVLNGIFISSKDINFNNKKYK